MGFSVRRSLAYMGGAQAATFVIMFGGSVVLARLLTPYEMGVYAAAAAILGILATLRSFGLGNVIIREPELTPSLAATTFTINAGLCVLSALALLGSAHGFAALYGNPKLEQLLLLLAGVPVLSAFEFLPQAYCERRGAFKRISAVGVGKAVVGTAVTVALAAGGWSYMSIAWGNLASGLLGVAWFGATERAGLRLELSQWRTVGAFGAKMLTVNVLSAVVQRLYDLILGRIVGLTGLGLWSRAAGLNAMVWDNVHVVLARITFVDFSERRRRGLPFRDAYLRIVALLTVLLWPAFTGLAILAGPVVTFVYGPAWVDAAVPLTLMSLSGVLLTAVTMTWEIYVVQGEVGAQIRFQLKRSAIGLGLFVAGCFGGLNWAAASRLGDGLATFLLAKPDLERMTDTRAADYWPIYAQSGAATAVACLPAAVLMAAHGWSPHTPLLDAMGAAAAGAVLWLGAVRALRHPIYAEIRAAWWRLAETGMRRLRRAAAEPAAGPPR